MVRKGTYENPYLLYSIFFAFIWVIVLMPFVMRGNGLIAEADSFNQSFPVFIYAGDYVRGMFAGRMPLFDFRIGLGDDVIATLNVHGFGDVLLFLTAFIPIQYAEEAFIITMLLKYYLCGIAFIIYIRKYISHYLFQVAGALMYAFTIFALVYGSLFWTFINPMIALPLILYGVDNVLENRKKLSLWLILGLFIPSLNGFYFLYQVIIITGIYFFVVSIIRKRNIVKDGFSLIFQGIIGVGLGGVILLPSIVGFLSSTRTSVEGFWESSILSIIDLFFAGGDFYFKSFQYLFMPSAYESIVTIPIILLAGAVIILVGKVTNRSGESGEYREFAVLWGVCGLLFCLPVFNRIMNGFSYATDRWYYAILLFGIIATVLVMQNDKFFSRKAKVMFWAIAFLSLIVNLIYSDKGIGDMLRTLFFVATICLLPFIWNREKDREKWLFSYVVIIVAASGLFVFGPKILGGSGFSAGFKPHGAALAEMQESVSLIKKSGNEFERLDIYSSSLNTSLVMDYYGTAEYFSMLNRYVSKFYYDLSISPVIHAAAYNLQGLDSRIELASLLGVSHYTDFELNDRGEQETVIKFNEYKLPLAFTYESWISEEDFRNMNPMKKASNMAMSAVLASEIDENVLQKNTSIDDENMTMALMPTVKALSGYGCIISIIMRK